MNRPKLSILVPIYKVEPYLRRCVDSVLAQSFTDWEMVLVDDGSPDGCPAICDEYAAADDRITTVHKQNGGLISARQVGVERAQGEWLMFLDSDDELTPGTLETLMRHASDDVDMVKGGMVYVNPDGTEQVGDMGAAGHGVVEGGDSFMGKMYSGELAPYLWGGIYRSSLFSSELFDFGGYFTVGEDWITNVVACQRLRRAVYIDDVVYRYSINPASMMHTQVVGPKYIKRIDELFERRGVMSWPSVRAYRPKRQVRQAVSFFFYPELPFRISDYLGARRCAKSIGSMDWLDDLDKRVRFFNIPVLYIPYVWLYRLYILHIKQKGRKRKILE